MSALLRISVPTLLLIGLGACATTSETAYTPPERTPSIMDKDEAYIAAVERIARRRGILVQWVNAPTKSAAQVQRELGEPQQ